MADISKIKSNRLEGNIEIGDICYSLRTEKEGWLLCDGQSYSKTDYEGLFEVIGYTYGGEGDNFNVPNYQGMFLQMKTADQTIGQFVEAGLPNITGSVGYTIGTNSSASGCFTKTDNTNSAWWQGATNVNRASIFSLDASLSNSIYGNSEIVQPPAYIVNYFIKY